MRTLTEQFRKPFFPLYNKNLSVPCWEKVLSDALHTLRSLLCTAANCNLHERIFNHYQRSSNGKAIPFWLRAGPVYIKRHVCSKHELLIDEGELLEVNPNYAHVCYVDGRQNNCLYKRPRSSLREVSGKRRIF